MSSMTDRAEIEAVFQQLARAHADHDADAIAESYAPDAVIYDLAPPLGRQGMNRDSVAAWLAGWEGPILRTGLNQYAIWISRAQLRAMPRTC